jgi:diguanylate cyclase (GGDEF)-like protein/PAS domain S-box-containing protein
MKDQPVTNQSLIMEMDSLRQRVAMLEQREADFRFLAETMGDLVFMVDMELRTTYVSPSVERILGYTVAERMTQKVDEQLTPKAQKLILETLAAELEREKAQGSDKSRSVTLELECYHKDGSIKYLDTYVRGMRDSKGNLTGFYGLSRDMTKRKQAEEGLRQECSFRNAIIDNVAEGLCVCHEIAKYPFIEFTIWNDRMTEITGYTMEQINSLGWYQTMYPDPELQSKAIERIKEMREGVDIRQEEWEIVQADEHKRVLNISTSIIESEDGLVHVLALMKDITESKQTQRALRESETRYRLLAENATDVIWTVDMDMRLTYVSPSITRLLGFTAEEAMAQTMQQAYTPATFEKAMRVLTEEMAIESAGRGDASRSRILELELVRKDGSTVSAEGNFCFLRDPTGTPIGIISMVRNLTERKRAEEALRESEERYKRITETITDYIYTVRLEGGAVVETKHSPGCEVVTGYSEREYAGDPDLWLRMVVPEDRSRVLEQARQSAAGEDAAPIEHRIVRKDGVTRWVRSTPVLHRDERSALLGYDGLVQDITEHKDYEEMIHSLSMTDHLTGLYNRRGLLSLAEQQLKMAERTRSGLLLLFADLDDLKNINDKFGHKAGDNALIRAADVFKDVFRKVDIIARVGGDEFAILMPGVKLEYSDVARNRLQERLTMHNAQVSQEFIISMSIGISFYDPEAPSTMDELMSRADNLMYEQKKSRRKIS